MLLKVVRIELQLIRQSRDNLNTST